MSPRSWLAPWKILHLQDRIITAQRVEIDRLVDELNRVRLQHFREVHRIVDAWLIHHDQPETDMRPELLSFSGELGDQIAKLEELIV